MSTHCFYIRCDLCRVERSEEYGGMPSCRECLRHTCLMCDVPSERTDADLDCPETTICRECHAAETVTA